MKRFLTMIFSTMCVGNIWAYDFQSGVLYYNITSDSTVEVTQQYSDGNNYSNIEAIDIPESVAYNGFVYFVTGIANNAFEYCGNLKAIAIPKSVISIGHWAFNNCVNLKSISIPNTITYIGQNAFDACVNLDYNSYDNAFYIGNKENPYVVLMESRNANITSCEISTDCKVINTNAFMQNNQLKSIIIPDSVKCIGYMAFSDCSELKSVTISNSVTSIEGYAFNGCHKLAAFTISNSISWIPESMFMGTALATLSIPNSVERIGKWAFQFSELTNITIPESVVYIEAEAFAYTNLTSVVIPKSVEWIGGGAFTACPLNNVVCKAVIPPQITQNDPFPSCDTIYVPLESLNDYMAAAIWKRKIILPISVLDNNNNNGDNSNLGEQIENEYDDNGASQKDNTNNTNKAINFLTDVNDKEATTVNIYAYGNIIVVENVEDTGCMVEVLDISGRLVSKVQGRCGRIEIPIDGGGIYIVKSDAKIKRVSVR